jgi:nucleoside-diphosphate-sugar epimerase
MKVLITGSNGFIGKKLVNFLIKNKIEIIAFGTENQNLSESIRNSSKH